MRKYIPICGLLLAILGCGQWGGLPGPTNKKIAAVDVVGTWAYTADFGKTVITLTINGDGTFQQVVKPAGQKDAITGSGTWKLDGAEITLDKVLTNEGHFEQKGWVPDAVSWYLIDCIGGKPPVAIFGGTHPDPDSWQAFRKVQ
jgi:hypothetical protein